jgi:hypothetical protein
MSRKIFISYRFFDNEYARNIKTFFQPQGGMCDGEPVFVTRDRSAEGREAIDAEIRTVMGPCAVVLLVVGDDNHNSRWIDREVELAVSRNLPMLAVRLPGKTGGLPNRVKEILKDRPVQIVAWREAELCPALNALQPPKATS